MLDFAKLIALPTGGRKKELSCRQSEPENIQGPVTGQGKTNSTEALQQQEPQRRL